MFRLVFLVLCLLTACVSAGGNTSFENEMQRWVGRSEGQLYQAWGMPANVYNITPQEKVLTYVRRSLRGTQNPYSDAVYYGGTGEESWWDRLFGPPESNQARVYYCKISFVVQRGVVVSYNFNGDNCVINSYF